MERYISNFDYGMNGIGNDGSSTRNGDDRESNSSLYYTSNQNRHEAGGYPMHETYVTPQESEYTQTSSSLYYHDPRSGIASNPTPCVHGEYNGGIAAPSYMLQQPAASQYLGFHIRRPHENAYHQAPSTAGSHCLGNNQTILAAARELCGSPFEDHSHNLFDINADTSRNNNNYQKEASIEASIVQNSKLPLPNTSQNTLQTIAPINKTSLKNPPDVNEQEQLQSKANNQHSDEVDELVIFEISIPSLHLTPMTGKEVVDRVVDKTNEVVTRYLPCVELLVACQQDLRAGLTQKSNRRCHAAQFYRNLLEPLPDRFYRKYQNTMPGDNLQKAYHGIKDLLADAKKVERTGCEGMKNTFLGGMRDGESWGLRRWLSKNGGALQICNDLELILGALRKLPKSVTTTKLFAEKIGPKAKVTYDKLKDEVPNAYQEVSSAHPYLPFFHRLESALKGLLEFNPNQDDVICLDDSSDDDTILEVGNCSDNTAEVHTNASIERNAEILFYNKSGLFESESPRYERSGTESPILLQGLVDEARKASFDNDSDVELVGVKKSSLEESSNAVSDILSAAAHRNKRNGTVPTNLNYSAYDQVYVAHVNQRKSMATALKSADELVGNVEKIVQALETGQDIRPQSAQGCRDFWTNPPCMFVVILRLIQKLISNTASHGFLDPVDANEYNFLIKNPLCIRDIVSALCDDDSCESYAVNGARIVRKTGVLECSGLKKWNMFEGNKLIQAVDLVFLNTLAFMGKSTDLPRKEVMKLRKYFWGQIRSRALGDKNNIPTKRKESSGFVIRLK